MKTLTWKDFTKYRGAVTARARALLGQARGTRWDRIAGRVAGLLGFVAGLSAYVGIIPAKYAAPFAGICAFCAMLAPRAMRAAGLMAAAYDQQRPLLPVLWEVAQVFANPTAIIAEAKSAAQDAERAQTRQQAAMLVQEGQQKADQEKAQQTTLIETAVEAAVGKAVAELSSRFRRDQLSQDVPDNLKAAFAAPAADPIADQTMTIEQTNDATDQNGETP